MDHYGLERIDRIRLAGAFGSQIDPVHALVLGLIPTAIPSASRRPETRPAPARASRS